jgi:hypothetical protein
LPVHLLCIFCASSSHQVSKGACMRHDQELDFKMSSLQKAFSGWRPKADLQVPSKHNICI